MQTIKVTLEIPVKDFGQLLEQLEGRTRKQLMDTATKAGLVLLDTNSQPIKRLGKKMDIAEARQNPPAANLIPIPSAESASIPTQPQLPQIPPAPATLFQVKAPF